MANIAIALSLVPLETIAEWVGIKKQALIDHIKKHLRNWPRSMKKQYEDLMLLHNKMTAREMAEGVYKAAMKHIETVEEQGVSISSLEHFEKPADIALRAAEMVGRITGEIPPEMSQNVVGPGQQSPVAVLVMPRSLPAPSVEAEIIGENKNEDSTEGEDASELQSGEGDPES